MPSSSFDLSVQRRAGVSSSENWWLTAFFARTNFGEVPPRVEYTLTPQGESFVPILLAMKQWGKRSWGFKAAYSNFSE